MTARERRQDSGLYLVVVRLSRPIDLVVGRLGPLAFDPGLYLYVGSARRGLERRVARHHRRDKPLRWHIDYLTAHPAASVVRSILFRGADPAGAESVPSECALNQALATLSGGRAAARGFGASDCTGGCPAHLWYVTGDGGPRAADGAMPPRKQRPRGQH